MVVKELVYFFRHPIQCIEKAILYENLSKQHTENVNKLTQEYGKNQELKTKINEQTDNLAKLSREKSSLLNKCNELEDSLLNAETQRDSYVKQVEERNRLIDYLKKDKREILKFADYVVREKSTEPLIVFLKNSKIPYVLVNPRTQKIIDYNDSFSSEIGLNGTVDLRGNSYHAILDGRENREILSSNLRKFLDVDEKKEFDVDYQKNGKSVLLHVTKQKPVAIDVDLGFLGKKGKEARVITCVPLVVEKASTFQKYHPHSLESVMEETVDELKLLEEAGKNMSNVTARLVEYGWGRSGKTKTSDKITEILDKMETTKAYLYFEKVLNALDSEAEKNRRAEKRQAARFRLRQMKEKRKKREERQEEKLGYVLKMFWKQFKIRKKVIRSIYDESKDWEDFVSKYKVLYKVKLGERDIATK